MYTRRELHENWEVKVYLIPLDTLVLHKNLCINSSFSSYTTASLSMKKKSTRTNGKSSAFLLSTFTSQHTDNQTYACSNCQTTFLGINNHAYVLPTLLGFCFRFLEKTFFVFDGESWEWRQPRETKKINLAAECSVLSNPSIVPHDQTRELHVKIIRVYRDTDIFTNKKVPPLSRFFLLLFMLYIPNYLSIKRKKTYKKENK